MNEQICLEVLLKICKCRCS